MYRLKVAQWSILYTDWWVLISIWYILINWRMHSVGTACGQHICFFSVEYMDWDILLNNLNRVNFDIALTIEHETRRGVSLMEILLSRFDSTLLLSIHRKQFWNGQNTNVTSCFPFQVNQCLVKAFSNQSQKIYLSEFFEQMILFI